MAEISLDDAFESINYIVPERKVKYSKSVTLSVVEVCLYHTLYPHKTHFDYAQCDI